MPSKRAPASPVAAAKAPEPRARDLQMQNMDLLLQSLDYLESGVVVYGPDNRVLFCNRRFKEIYAEIADLLTPGTPYEAIARSFYQLRHDQQRDLSEEEYVALRLNKHRNPDHVDEEYQLRDGTWLLVSDRKTPQGCIIGWRLDISERKAAQAKLMDVERQATRELEAKVQERTRDLQRSNKMLTEALEHLKTAQDKLVQSEKLASLGNLVAGIAHEINTPLGNALLAASALDEKARAFSTGGIATLTRSKLQAYVDGTLQGASIVLNNLERAAALVQNFKQISVDRVREEPREFMLHALVGDVLLAMQPTLKSLPYRVQLEVPHDIRMTSHPGAISQVLMNFVNNAILHGFDKRAHGVMWLRARQDGAEVEMVFSDDGKGMSKKTLAKVFDPFFTTKMGQGGSGLGMFVVHALVHQVLLGSIDVQSQIGKGTRWKLRIPAQVAGSAA